MVEVVGERDNTGDGCLSKRDLGWVIADEVSRHPRNRFPE